MENSHVQRRSLSHGSLRSSYKSNARPPVGRTLPRRPLRSVNENSTLLPSPGPLESMLKTTTETGDIGIFTIKPIAPAATLHHCARSRPSLDAGSIFRPESRGSNATESRVGSRRRGSNRDTTSEIISMYDSESYPSSCISSLSPRPDLLYQRSYSLNSCGPRQLFSHQSPGVLQSPSSSSSILQRPRSPFPYPTRLKRPGVRPSSPALTENGRVDYSRMVEIDRISHRTIHGSYKPTFPHTQRLAPPLPLRYDVNQSMPSLPYASSFMATPGSDACSQNHWATPTNSWSHGRSNPSRRPSTDQSVRSPSLGSVIDMYYRPTSASGSISARTLRQAASFYYDYTEGFDSPEDQMNTPSSIPATPLAPIPKRASSLVKALVLRDETKARLDAVVDVSVKDSSDSSGDDGRAPNQTPADDLQQMPFQNGEDANSPPNLALFSFEVDGTSASRPASVDAQFKASETISISPGVGDDHRQFRADDVPSSPNCQSTGVGISKGQDAQVLPNKVIYPEGSSKQSLEHSGHTVDERDGDAVATKTNITRTAALDHGMLRKSPSAPAAIDPMSRRVSSHGGLSSLLRSSLRHSVDPSLSDLAALVSSFERLAKSPFLKKDLELSEMTDGPNDGKPRSPHDIKSKDPKITSACNDEATPPHANNQGTEIPFLKGHRRNWAVTRISTTSLRYKKRTPASSVDTPIICPQPVSPARQLKLRNSIPQLMKALPSLPDEVSPPTRQASMTSGEDPEFPVKFSPFQLEILATPRSSPRITPNPNVEDHGSFRASIELEAGPVEPEQQCADQPLASNANLKERGMEQEQNVIKAGQSPQNVFPKNQGDDTDKQNRTRPRLRLRRSRPRPSTDGCLHADGVSTVRRYLDRSEQNVFTELPVQPKDLFTPARRGEPRNCRAYQRRGRQFRLVTPTQGSAWATRDSQLTSIPADSILQERDIPLAHPVDRNLLRQSSSIEGYDLSDTRSFSSELTFIRPRILRKKFSNLKVRLARSRLNMRDREDKIFSDGQIDSADSRDSVRIRGQRATVPPSQSRKRTGKMRGWIRRAVHIVVKGW